MKVKSQPTNVKSGNYLEQALYKGLNKKQTAFVKDMISKFDYGEKIPYGHLRKVALKIK